MGSTSQLLRTTGCGLMVRFPTSQTSGPERCLRVRITLILKTICSYEESQREAWGGGQVSLNWSSPLPTWKEKSWRGGGGAGKRGEKLIPLPCSIPHPALCIVYLILTTPPPRPRRLLDYGSSSDVSSFLKYHPTARSLAQSRCSVIPLKSCVRRSLLGPTPRRF